MTKSKTLVSVLELKRLLIELKDKRSEVCIRYRLIGELWATNFRRVIQVTEKGAYFNDETSNKLYTVSDLSNIMQFELDRRFQNFEPFFHYDITLDHQY